MTQTEKILRHLQRGSITPMQAFDRYNVTCLAERIRDLRKRGHKIMAEMVSKGGKRFARYRLVA